MRPAPAILRHAIAAFCAMAFSFGVNAQTLHEGSGTASPVADNGTRLTCSYDAAPRLTSITDSLGNKVVYTLDAEGNRKGDDTKDVSGQLAQTLTRAFDGLSRIKEARGGVNPAIQLSQYGYDGQAASKCSYAPQGSVASQDGAHLRCQFNAIYSEIATAKTN